MATGPFHYREAERLLQPRTVHSIPMGEPRQAPPTTDMILQAQAQAQAHATLALAAATAALDAIEGPHGVVATGRSAEDWGGWREALTGGGSDG